MPAQSSSISFRGLQRVYDRMSKLEKKMPQDMGEGLTQLAHQIKYAAQQKAPADTGKLKASGQVDVTSQHNGARWDAMITFSAFSDRGYDYAEMQHENDSYSHSIGESHYLKKAIDEFAAKGKRTIADMLMRILRSY